MPPSADGNSIDSLNAALAGRYRLERALGHGGMATVYLADDLRHERRVAVKIIHSELAHAVMAERFLREIRIEAQLNHPNIITLLDSGVIELPSNPPRPFYVMPYVEGESLRDRLRREGSLPVDEAVEIVREVAHALEYAHRQGVIHRDIKPENILLSQGRPVVADFGIARLRVATNLAGVSSGALALGTPYYMSPEQWSADPRLDGRTDIYSLGCVLYEMLAGEPPFTGPSVEAVRARHAVEPPRPLKTIRPSVPDRVMAVIARSMAKTPADRYTTAGELAAALVGSAVLAQSRKRRWGLLGGGLVLTAGAVASILWMRPDPIVDPQRFAVLPFQEREGVTRGLVSGDAAASELRDALDSWRGLTIVNNLLLGDVLRRRPAPRSLRDALVVARDVQAGYLVWGEVWTSSDTTYLQAGLYDVTRRGALRAEHTVPLVPGPLRGQFSALADSLLVGALPGSQAAAGAVSGTTSFEALRAYAAGDSALAAWNLELAAKQLRAALALDADYPQANLRLAQLLQWNHRPTAEWRRHAEAALRQPEPLSAQDSGLAAALVAMAHDRYSAACGSYRALLQRDSLDFAAWFGLGECQSRDSVVVPDDRSPSGWRFRSSYASAVEAYTRALSLLPSVHLAYQGAAFDRLRSLLFSEPGRVRLGTGPPPESRRFGAFPSLVADTLAFIPFLIGQVFSGSPEAVPASRGEAITRNRVRLREIAGSWVRDFPKSPPALMAWALALEAAGELGEAPEGAPSALEAVRSLRRSASGTEEAGRAAAWEVRLLVKTRQFDQARGLADSLLTVAPTSPQAALRLAGLAALLGRPHRTADLLARSAETWVPRLPDLREVSVPGPLKETALRLVAFAAFGLPADSLRTLQNRVLRDITALVPPEQREAAQLALLSQPAILAFTVLESQRYEGYLSPILDGIRTRDTGTVRRSFEAIRFARRGQAPGDVTIDIAYVEARLLLAIGDSAGALAWLRPSLHGLPSLGVKLLEEVSQAAALGAAMSFGAQLAAAAGRRDEAREWALTAAALWAEAEPVLEPSVRRLRRLAQSS